MSKPIDSQILIPLDSPEGVTSTAIKASEATVNISASALPQRWLSEDPLRKSLLLSLLPGLGAASYWRLMDGFDDSQGAIVAFDRQLQSCMPTPAWQAFNDYIKRGNASEVGNRMARTIDWCAKHQVTLLDVTHADYPKLLRNIRRPPPILYVRGNVQCLSLPQIAVVGSRNSSPGGRTNATIFCSALASSGFTITSGLALGIDAAAHKAAITAKGTTVAVIGTGIDQSYPMRNVSLAAEIVAEGGAIVSEFPLGTSPMPANFPQRNRIISGLSCGTLVVEAALKSGSLITAKYALEQNREVFAIPGSIHNPKSRGCHALIKQGAKLVETAEDIAEELAGMVSFHSQELGENKKRVQAVDFLSETDKTLLNKIDYEAAPLEVLVERSELSISEVIGALISLELQNLIVSQTGGYVRTAS
ncbi:MAG: DNA processing protein [Lentisphaeria bacterium]|jgi:DNA processing protein